MPFCPVCKYEYDDTVSACPCCGSDLIDVSHVTDDESANRGLHEEETRAGIIDMDQAVLIYRSYSRVNTDFLVETLKSADIPHYCRVVGGLYGRGMPDSVGFFGTKAVDAEIYVPPEYEEEAEEIRRQTVGDN
jgi:hypothetical protein